MPVWPGETFLLPKPGHDTPHLWIVLTEPDEQVPPHVAIVNLTSFREGADTTVVLATGDHPFIRHHTVVYYGDLLVAPAQKLVDAVRAGIATRHDDLTDDILERVREGVFRSPFTHGDMKAYCRNRW